MNHLFKYFFAATLILNFTANAMDTTQKPQDKSLIPAEWVGKTVRELIEAGLIAEAIEGVRVRHNGTSTTILELIERGLILESTEEAQRRKLGNQLCEAAWEGNHEEVKQLIDKSADVNHESALGRYRVTPLKAAAINDFIEIARLLIAAKADLDKQSWSDDKTALAHAADIGNQDIVHLLLEAGADVTATDRSREQNTALQHAMLRRYQSHRAVKYEICKAIIEKMLYVPNADQLKRLFTFECCLQRTFRKDIKNLIKASLPGIIAQENREEFEKSYACEQIYRMTCKPFRRALLDTYIPDREIKRKREEELDLKLEEYLAKAPDIRHCPTNWCRFRYALETPAAHNGNWIYRWIFGEPASQSRETFKCPNCEQDILINQPKTTKPLLFNN